MTINEIDAEKNIVRYLVKVFNPYVFLSEEDITSLINKMTQHQYINLVGHAQNILKIVKDSQPAKIASTD